MAFKLTYKQRDESTFVPLISASVGSGWTCSWLSVVNGAAVRYSFGGEGFFDTSSNPGQLVGNYHNRLKFKSVLDGLGNIQGYEMHHPDGSRDIYGFGLTDARYGIVYVYYLTQKVSPSGYTINFYYEPLDPAYPVARLQYVVDADGRTNKLHYATSGFSTNLITQVDDPYGRSAYLQYDNYGQLTNITDAAGMSSSIAYNELGWPTNLTTLYGTTVFQPVDMGNPLSLERNVTVTEPNNGKQLFLFSQDPLTAVSNYPSADVPTNTPLGTLNNTNVNLRVSYHWGSLQYAALSTPDPDSLTENDFFKGRLRHWLGDTVHGEDGRSMDTLSLERAPSPDGVTEGQKTWYDYANKGYYGTGDKGDHILPNVIARVLPDGSTWYQWLQRNEWQSPTNILETYTKPDGSIGLRSNVFIYDTTGHDLVMQIGSQGEQVVSNYFGNAYHQVDASYDALNQGTLYTYNANRQLTSVKTPGGLTTTNFYFTSGSVDRLDKTIDLEIKRTNSYTYYANGLVLSHTDERGLTVTNYWDNLQRLTGTKHPDGTTTSNRYTALSRRARTGWGIGVTPATMGFGKRPPRRMPMESLLVTACANAARCSTSRMPGILRSRS